MVAVAFAVGDRLQVTGNTQKIKTNKNISVLLSAHVDIFSVFRTRNVLTESYLI